MLSLHFPAGGGPHVLCLGAHCDDIEIGCGGTILRLVEQYSQSLTVDWFVFASDTHRKSEAVESATRFLQGAGCRHINVREFRDGFFPYLGDQIKEAFEEIKPRGDPDIIFTHYRHDRHQDHRVISDLTWNTFRHHCILEYEIPKYDGDFGTPNLFVSLEERLVQSKIGLITEYFQTQGDKHWFTEDIFRAVLRIRGMEANAASTYAEAFYARKLTLV